MSSVVTKVVEFAKSVVAKVRHGDLGTILGQFDKIVTKLESFVKVEQDALAKVHASIASLNTVRDAKNQNIDRAYRAIHNISSLSS